MNQQEDTVTIHEKIRYKYEPWLFITKPFMCSSDSFNLDGFCEFFLFPAIKKTENVPIPAVNCCFFTSSINLITGHLEEPMPNPMDEMTEEQKEYEAMKLVNMFDKLSRDELIKPMGVRPDGTMAPLEEAVSQYQTSKQESSDSD